MQTRFHGLFLGFGVACEISQLNCLLEQYKHETECNAITGQTREGKMQHHQSLMDGVLLTDEFMNGDLVSHEHETYYKHPTAFEGELRAIIQKFSEVVKAAGEPLVRLKEAEEGVITAQLLHDAAMSLLDWTVGSSTIVVEAGRRFCFV
ncbi:hypothetical protein KIW84_056724 [Lathyrus oleraceus]|uniref:Uncharacterized protein n=1 Tax=Pisum sativum TaxID=3888 RepID=A0A9D4X402_PEA|nr:hypothetical protein KIW84_056724 [Pisum sativum]